LEEPRILGNSGAEGVTALPIDHEDLPPWRRKKYALMVAVNSDERRQHLLKELLATD
jgi:hypothetical protein